MEVTPGPAIATLSRATVASRAVLLATCPWHAEQVASTIRALAAAGWLKLGTTPHSLRPGSRFNHTRQPAPPR